MGDTRTCQCHTNPYAGCDHPGGCGSSGGCCSTEGSERQCLTCPIFRPDATARLPHRRPICDGDRTLMDRHLTDISNLHADLTNPEPPIVERGRYERFGLQYLKDGARQVVSLGQVWKDPLAAVDGVAPINSRTGAPSVSGSRERPVPIRVDVVDLTAVARRPNPTRDPVTEQPLYQHLVPQIRPTGLHVTITSWWGGIPLHQQIRGREHVRDHKGKLVLTPAEQPDGHQSAATTLDALIRDIRDEIFPGQHLPPATADQMVMWLQVRLDDICDRYPRIVDFAEEVRALRGALRSAAGVTEPQPELCPGVACSGCKKKSMFRMPGDTYRAQCVTCGKLFSDAEYAEAVEAQGKKVRQERSPEEVHDLLRRN